MNKNSDDGVNADIDGVDVTGYTGHSGVMSVKDQLGDINEENIHRIEPNKEVYMEQLSEYKYDTVAAMIREYIQNSNATVIEASEYVGDDYSPLIFVGYYPHEKRLIIMDNGMGWSREKIDSVGTKPGTSTNIYNPKRPGSFGIGRISAFKGVGSDGGFFMHTRSRRTGEYIKGIWTADAFVENDDLEDKLEEEQYGTLFSFPLKYVDVDIEEKVKEYANCLRNTVLYVRYGKDGRPDYKGEYGGTQFTENADTGKCIIYEDEYVRIVCGKSQNDTGHGTDDYNSVLMDVPCKLNHTVDTSDIPFSRVNFLVKQEQQFIVDGPNKGKIRVKDGEYEKLTEEEKESGKYIKHSDTLEEDVPLLYPTGDRDRFHKNQKFIDWSSQMLHEEYIKRLNSVLADIVNADNIVNDLDYENLSFFMEIMKGVNYRRSENVKIKCIQGEIEDTIEKALSISSISNDDIPSKEAFEKEILSEIEYLTQTIEICPREKGNLITERHYRERIPHWKLFRNMSKDSTVYMCVRPVMKKAKAIWQDSDENMIVRVKSTDHYTVYEKRHGWKKLTDLDNEAIEKLDITDELKERIKSNDTSYENPNAGKDARNRELNVHTIRKKYNNRKNVTKKKSEKIEACEIKEKLESEKALANGIEKIVLFPSNCNKKVSDYYKWYPYNNVGVATCSVKTFNYLSDCDNVFHIDEEIQNAKSVMVATNMGEIEVDKFINSDKINLLHVVHDEAYSEFAGSSFAKVEDRVLEKASYSQKFEDHIENIQYGIIKRSELFDISILLGDYKDCETTWRKPHKINIMINEGRTNVPIASDRVSLFDSDTELYVYARLPKWNGSEEFKSLADISLPLLSGGYNTIETIAQSRYDKGLEPLSVGGNND